MQVVRSLKSVVVINVAAKTAFASPTFNACKKGCSRMLVQRPCISSEKGVKPQVAVHGQYAGRIFRERSVFVDPIETNAV